MFISYQTVRNSCLVGVLGLAGLGIYWTSGNPDTPSPIGVTPALVAPAEVAPTASPTSTASSPIPEVQPNAVAPLVAQESAGPPATTSVESSTGNPAPAANTVAEVTEIPRGAGTGSAGATGTAAASSDTAALLARAMQIAQARANPQGGKDVLGSSSPWKLNLYDDNRDGQWDRGKLDINRDEIDDEKWNFKQGRWEKDGGALVWLDGAWRSADGAAPAVIPSTPSSASTVVSSAAPNNSSVAGASGNTAELDQRYQAAMKIATSRAVNGKGKDVLGASHPWKLNLYDDNQDGQWDRGKLDTNRDEVDDEKWNFKQGRWEKDGGAKIWDGTNWVDA